MEVEKLLLPAREFSHIDNVVGIDPHAMKRWPMSYWRDYEFSVVFKANEPTIEEMMDARSQKQAVLTI
jgi:hypothetical protein